MSPSPSNRIARALYAPGRFLCAAALLWSGACQTVGAPGTGPRSDEGPPPVVLAQGAPTDAERDEAERLLVAARSSLEARRLYEVLRTTEEIMTRFPATAAAGEALRLSARTELELGNVAEADESATRYIGLLGPGDPRADEMRLLQAEALEGQPLERLDRLLTIEEGASTGVLAQAEAMARPLADSLTLTELEGVIGRAPTPPGPIAPIVEARLAVTLLEYGRDDEARLHAQRAVDGGAAGTELEWARGVLAGELPEGRGRTTVFSIGAVLPNQGPPALAEYAAQVFEGIQVAAATVLGEEFDVSIVVRDSEGDPLLGAEQVAELEGQGVVGVVGLLLDDELTTAAGARTSVLPLVSPTARSADRSGPGVFSLEGPNLQAARSVARYAASRAFQRIAMVYPRTAEAEAEADAFAEVATSLGIEMAGRFPYDPGATFFEPQVLGARDALRSEEIAALGLAEEDTLRMEMLEPAALFLPIPPEDVEFIAPQVIHFGLDTLAIEMLGTSGWTDPQALSAVDARLTTGVVATAPVGAGPQSEGAVRFREAYEGYYQRSLVGPTAAVGYDATLLLLEALRPGRVAPQQAVESFGALEAIQGATGVFSIVDGQVVRRTEVVRVENRSIVPVDESLLPTPPLRWPGDGNAPLDTVGPGPLTPPDTVRPDTLGADTLPSDTLRPDTLRSDARPTAPPLGSNEDR